jgi:hypothetical protein
MTIGKRFFFGGGGGGGRLKLNEMRHVPNPINMNMEGYNAAEPTTELCPAGCIKTGRET